MTFTDDMTLKAARDTLRPLVREGHTCPCCRQFAKVYKRALPSASAVVLIAMYRWRGERTDEGWIFIPDLLTQTSLSRTAQQGGYGLLSHHWGLIEKQVGTREDGSDRVGFWRLTEKGRLFVRSLDTVEKYALLYNGRCLGHEGPQINIHDALGKKFDYSELMAA